MFFPMLLLPFIPLVVVPIGLYIVLTFRHKHGCDACSPMSYSCPRHDAGKSCPFFE